MEPLGARSVTAAVGLDDDSLETLHRAYLDAIYRWGQGGRWRTIRIGEPAPEIEAAFPDARRFGMLSAWNPRSVLRPEAVNRAEDERLHAAIDGGGWRALYGFASAPDRNWREPNWIAIDIPESGLDALARRFGQLGTLHWHRGQAVRLRMDAARPPGARPHPHVDWIQ